MPSKGGLALRGADSFLRCLEFLCAAVILGIMSYFLAYLTRHDRGIPTWMKAVEGMAGAAVIYTAFATLLTCFLGGKRLAAILAILLDTLFCAAMVAIAVLARGGRRTSGRYSPLGNNRVRDAKMQTAVFAVSIIAAFLFLLTAIWAVLMMRKHKAEKKYGPGPSNGYTSGTGKKPPFWKRNKGNPHDAELGAMGTGSAAIADEKHKTKRVSDMRPSHETGMTGSTAAAADATYGGTSNKYSEPAAPTHHNASNGYTPYSNQQTGTQFETAPVHGHTGGATVIHDPKPYAEVHNQGLPHSHPESEQLYR